MPSIKVNFSSVPDAGEFGPLPLGRYAARMHVDAYQHDAQGGLATNGDGEPVFWSTSAGDSMWKLEMEVLEGAAKGRKLFDQLSFGPGGMKRVKVIYKRGGFADTDADEEIELYPEDLDKTCWWIDVDRHEVAMERDGKTPRTAKRAFQRKGCACSVCTASDGQLVMVNSRIAFAGFEPMKAAEAKKFSQNGGAGASPEGICMQCQKGDHTHTEYEDKCQCSNSAHPPF